MSYTGSYTPAVAVHVDNKHFAFLRFFTRFFATSYKT